MMPSLRRKRLASMARIGLAWAALCVIAFNSRPAQAQAPGPGGAPAAVPGAAPAAAPGVAPAGAAAAGVVFGEYYYRLGFLTFDHLAYTNHPFIQITGNSAYANGPLVTNIVDFGAYDSDSHAPVLLQLLHSLPPFYLEAGMPVNLFVPKAVSFGFDYYEFSQTGSDAAGGSGPSINIKTDMWLYEASLRGYAFDATQPGINFYMGLGFGFLQGNLTAQTAANPSGKVIGFSQFPTGSFMFGIDLKGDNFGLRYEVNIFSAKQVGLDSNPYPGRAPKTIDFSGSLTRAAVFYQF